MNKESQQKIMIKAMRNGKVKNHEFMGMYIMSYTKRLSEIRQSGINVSKERLYDSSGKATGTFIYWIPEEATEREYGDSY